MKEKRLPNRACRRCEFFQTVHEVSGFCRRYAPRPREQFRSTAEWPLVFGSSWCGEFVERDRIPAGATWEYLSCHHTALDELGADGWEVVGLIQHGNEYCALLKRQRKGEE